MPTTSHRSSASVTSLGTVPRFSPTIVVSLRAASAAITASSSSRGYRTYAPSVARAALGDPPEPLDAHHVVDAQHGRVLTRARDELPPQGVPASAPGARQLGREPPVLALGEELVGRRAHGHPGGEERAVGPRLVAVRGGCRSADRAPARPAPDLRSRRAGGGRGTGRARGCARRGPAGARRRAGRGRWRGTARSRRRPAGRRRSAAIPVWMYGSRSLAASSSWRRRRRASSRQSMSSSNGGAEAAGSDESSTYTSFQWRRLTGAYGLGSNGSSRNAA